MMTFFHHSTNGVSFMVEMMVLTWLIVMPVAFFLVEFSTMMWPDLFRTDRYLQNRPRTAFLWPVSILYVFALPVMAGLHEAAVWSAVQVNPELKREAEEMRDLMEEARVVAEDRAIGEGKDLSEASVTPADIEKAQSRLEDRRAARESA